MLTANCCVSFLDEFHFCIVFSFPIQVVPSEVGQQRQPPYFFLLPSFWRARRARNSDEKLLAHWLSRSAFLMILLIKGDP